jgi:hypothetical protein
MSHTDMDIVQYMSGSVTDKFICKIVCCKTEYSISM